VLILDIRMESAAIGPGIGPAVAPAPLNLPAAPVSLPSNPMGHPMDGGFGAQGGNSAQVQAPSTMFNLAPGQQQPVVLPPLHYQGLASSQPFGYTPPPPGMHPSRAAALAGTKPGGVAGTIRSADEMLEGDVVAGPAKTRPKVGRIADGSLYPEESWRTYYPVRPNSLSTVKRHLTRNLTGSGDYPYSFAYLR
jgi:splicing factor 3A subunit 1